MLRCTGEVVRTSIKSGTSAKTGNPYRIREFRVLVGRADFIDLSLGDDAPDVRDGDQVDLAVTFSGVFQGNAQFRAVGTWAATVHDLATV